MSDIPFNIQIDRVLDLLCSQIYDSPLSLLRENVQNAYDAILQRRHIDANFTNPEIRITIADQSLSICDNGIGMDEEGLKTHYWTAGSSGKNNPEARAAGVVGTFGIGAMANFGVCTELTVESKLYGTDITWISGVKKSELSLNNNCIYVTASQKQRSDYGTTIVVTISPDFILTRDKAINYLKPYVHYLSVPVYLNDELISLDSYDVTPSTNCIDSGVLHYKDSLFEFDYRIILNNGVPVLPQCKISNIIYNHIQVKGDVCLKASEDVLFGLRNSFGLAPIAVNSIFHLNGIVNLLTLVPTAGREAVSRESTSFISKLISIADDIVAKEIAKYPLANNSRELHAYIRNTKRYDLAGFIEIPVGKTEESIRLKDVQKIIDGKNVYYFKGNNKDTIESLKDNSNLILTFSNDYNRAHIQQQVLKQKSIPEMKDDVRITKIYDDIDLTSEEIAILMRTRMVIEDDYSLSNFKLSYAEISHGLSLNVRDEEGIIHIFFSRSSTELDYLKTVYKDNYALFEQFIKDMVRTRLYPRFSSYLPSATKEGADALFAYLQKKRELFTIENGDLGDVDDMMSDYLAGKKSMQDIINVARANKQKQKQEVNARNVGSVSDVLGGNSDQKEPVSNIESDPCMPMPPIMRLDKKIDFKVLRTDANYHDLNDIKLFLSLSDKLYRDYAEFFYQPHTTNVIWSMHRVIFFFTHASNNLTLYYQLDLDKPLGDNVKGAKTIPTTTIITKNKIFIPIVDEMVNYFNITQGVLKFMVKYDSVRTVDKE